MAGSAVLPAALDDVLGYSDQEQPVPSSKQPTPGRRKRVL